MHTSSLKNIVELGLVKQLWMLCFTILLHRISNVTLSLGGIKKQISKIIDNCIIY